MRRIVQGLSKKCLFDCIYCFVDDTYETNGQDELNDEILENIELIQPFCDYDVFACENCNWEKEIWNYTKYGKIISFATKAYVSKSKAQVLGNINRFLLSQGAFLHVGVTITTITDVEIIEKNTPDINKRIESLKNLSAVGIDCSVIMRPLLPTLTQNDIEYIIDSTRDFCSNYVYGPLYLNDEMKRYLESKNICVDTIEHRAEWRKNGPICRILDTSKSARVERELIDYCRKSKVKCLASNDDAVDDIRRKKMNNYYIELKERSNKSYGEDVVKSAAMIITDNNIYYGVSIKLRTEEASMTAISNVICNAISSGDKEFSIMYVYVETGKIEDVIDDETIRLLKEFKPKNIFLVSENEIESVKRVYEE